MSKFQNPVIKEITEKYRKIWAIIHANNLLSWDSEIYMPERGVSERSIALAELNVLYRELILKDDFVSLVEKGKNEKDLNMWESGTIRVLDREINKMKKIPPELLFELQKTSSEAFQVWKNAKAQKKFDAFLPYLKKLVDLNIQIAEKLGYQEKPYDALLDMYEEGLNTRDVKAVFDSLKPGLKNYLEKIKGGKFYGVHELEGVSYETSSMEKVNKEVLKMIEYPEERARIDVSPHPFTISMGINDVRITTRYEGYDFKRSLFSVLHEFGHATYELQIDPELDMTPIGTGVSLGIHEGQSRFWENVVSRTLAFTESVKPVLDKYLGFTSKYSPEDVYRYFAMVKPSPIRTEADEVTYNLHISLRFEIEQMLIEKELKPEDVPEVWDNMMQDLLGIKPADISEGALQDVHWAHGTFGYFPTYTLGNIVASMMMKKLSGKNKIYELVRNRAFKEIKEFLKENVHQYGSSLSPKDLLIKSFGKSYSPEDLLDYIQYKYINGIEY
ncbi:MAG: carboxypeptidase M32 [Thaumarchaeota archaeon]|jgi:carboxypeptidase Taq|nr:carboxypeptidase M32 [Nitrososphaerota archaeon]